MRGSFGALIDADGVLFRVHAPAGDAVVLDPDTIGVRRQAEDETMWIVVRLRGSGDVALSKASCERDDAGKVWRPVRTSEDPAFVEEQAPIRTTMTAEGPTVHFQRPGGVIFRMAAVAA